MLSVGKLAWTAVIGSLLGLPVARGQSDPAAGADAKSLEHIAARLKDYESRRVSPEDPNALSGDQVRDALRKVSDAQLDVLMDGLPDTHWGSGGYELCLTESIRRGGEQWEQRLKARLAKMSAADKGKDIFGRDSRALPLLTALRRVQKKDDPLTILVEGRSELESKLAYLPELRVLLTNVDLEQAPISIDVGGDYRGASRHNKWHVQVTDADGRRLPEREEQDMGGFGHPETIRYHESVLMMLNVVSYVAIDKPGVYTMVVMFHPTTRIGLLQSTDGLICCTSLPLKVTVQPITIETTPAEQTKAADLVRQLPKSGPVHILGGKYNESVGEFMAKDSPAGQLHEMDWNAVPALIKAVNSGQLNPTQCAWAFGLLFGITDQRNPMEFPGVLGPFEYRHSGWVAFGGGPGNGGSLSRGAMSMLAGAIDQNAQTQFAKAWQAWLDNGVLEIKQKADAPK